MRVFVLHNRYRQPGGEDVVVDSETALLRSGGHDVRRYEVQNPTDPACARFELARSPWNVAAARAVRTVVRDFRPDVAHVHNTWFSLSPSVVRAVHREGVPVVATFHNYRFSCLAATLYRAGDRCTDCVGTLPWRGVVRRCYYGSTSRSAAVGLTTGIHQLVGTWRRHVGVAVAPSQVTRSFLVQAGFPSDMVVVKPHHVADVGPRKAPPSASRLLVYAGRLSEDKGLHALLGAWRTKAPAHMRLMLVGDGELREEIASVPAPNVTLLPWLPSNRLHQLLLEARAVVLPTRMYETFGLVAVEALAAGAPVLSVAGGAISEAIGDAGPPPVPANADVETWQERLVRLSDDAAVDLWGGLARQRYQQRHDPVQALQRLLDVYAEAAARQHPS